MKKEHILVWIPILESLPEYDVPVLVTCGKEAAICKRDRTDKNGEHFEIVDADNIEEFNNVTHWMPLPELPK